MKTSSTKVVTWPGIHSVALGAMMFACGGEPPANEEDTQSVSQALRTPEVRTVAVLPAPSNDGLSVDRRGRLFVSNAGQFGAGGLQGTEVIESVARARSR